MIVRALAFIGVAFLMVALISAAAARLAPGYVFPDAAVVVIVFVGLRREPIVVVAIALAIGYLVGNLALSPPGLYETAAVAAGFLVYLVSGHLAGGGALFFAGLCAATTVFMQLLLMLLLYWGLGHAGFASFSTSLLLPQALATAVLGALAFAPLRWLDRRMAPEQRGVLPWG